jgi:hypothetical protein
MQCSAVVKWSSVCAGAVHCSALQRSGSCSGVVQ